MDPTISFLLELASKLTLDAALIIALFVVDRRREAEREARIADLRQQIIDHAAWREALKNDAALADAVEELVRERDRREGRRTSGPR